MARIKVGRPAQGVLKWPQRAQNNPQWRNHLAFVLRRLVAPQTEADRSLCNKNRRLREVLISRMGGRLDEDISKCGHLSTRQVRWDSDIAERTIYPEPESPDGAQTIIRRDRWEEAMRKICTTMDRKLEVYGYIGRGTYGTILVARESEPEDPENPRHYAIKIHHHKSLEWANIQGHSPTMGLWKDDMYIPMEAMGLALVWNSDVFPSFDSVYTHNDWHMTIMSAALDYDPIRNTIPDDDDDEDCAAINRFRAFIGTRCFDKKDTLLNEQQACKVSSQMLRGLRELLDMNIVHGDISLNNFVVGEDFSTKLLDLGLMSFDVQQDKLVFTDWAWVPFHEYHMLPEMAIEFSKPEIIAAYKTERQHRVHVKSHGSMMDLWRSSCIAFMLAHGHAPWENPEWNAHLARVWRTHESTGLQDGENYRDFWNARIEERNARRDRIINEECPMAEHLSQDCIDAFRVMLARDPSQRPNVAELETFPWFQSSWMDQDLGRRAHFVSHIKVDFDEGHGPSA